MYKIAFWGNNFSCQSNRTNHMCNIGNKHCIWRTQKYIICYALINLPAHHEEADYYNNVDCKRYR